jgi:hypothetical protein
VSGGDRRSVISLVELRAAAQQAGLRLALYRRRTYLGHGNPKRLAELEREAKGATDRLRRARAQDRPSPPPGGRGAS